MSDAPEESNPKVTIETEENDNEEEILDVSVEDFKSMAPVSAPPTPSSPPSVLPVNPKVVNKSTSAVTASSSADVPYDVPGSARATKRSMTTPVSTSAVAKPPTYEDWNDVTLPPILSSRVALALEAIGAPQGVQRAYRSLPSSPVCKETDKAFTSSQTMRINRRRTYNRKYSSVNKDPFGMRDTNMMGENININRRSFSPRQQLGRRQTASMGIGAISRRSTGQFVPKTEKTMLLSSETFLSALSPTKTHSSVVSFGRAESEPDLNREEEGALPGEVPVLLAQMNNAAVELNEHENALRTTRTKITKLDVQWKKDRETLLASVGAFHIQRADLYFTKMRELCHWKEQGSKLAEKYSTLSTTIGTMESSKSISERETRWRELRKNKATKVKNDIEQQMKDVAQTVTRLQQEAKTRSQEYPISVKKAAPFFEEYGLFLEKRRESISQQKELEQKILEAKSEYKSAMDRLEGISKEIHEERGTLEAATKKSQTEQD